MLISMENTDTLICDKCGVKQTEQHPYTGPKFYSSGWRFNSKAKKYIHLCINCVKPKR